MHTFWIIGEKRFIQNLKAHHNASATAHAHRDSFSSTNVRFLNRAHATKNKIAHSISQAMTPANKNACSAMGTPRGFIVRLIHSHFPETNLKLAGRMPSAWKAFNTFVVTTTLYDNAQNKSSPRLIHAKSIHPKRVRIASCRSSARTAASSTI